jgi:hypothetical protein
MLTGGSITPFAHSRSGKAYVETLARSIEHVAYMPILSGAPSIEEIMTTNFLSVTCKRSRNVRRNRALLHGMAAKFPFLPQRRLIPYSRPATARARCERPAIGHAPFEVRSTARERKPQEHDASPSKIALAVPQAKPIVLHVHFLFHLFSRLLSSNLRLSKTNATRFTGQQRAPVPPKTKPVPRPVADRHSGISGDLKSVQLGAS